ncbi:MAG: adenylate/guanylate cyclase domain-containing protein, partial [bacterium]
MNQDSYAIEHLWLVTAAMSILASFMLIEATNLIKILLAAVSIVVASSAPVFLEVEMLEYIIYLVHLLVITLISWVASWQVEMGRREAFARRLGVEIERERTVDLLRNILPESIANQLLSKPGTIAERHERVAVLFADIVEFTPWTATQEPQKVVATLDQIFSEFDRLCDRYGVEKIKTIGDAYMAAGGVPQGSQAKVQDVVRLALEMLEVVQQIPTGSAKSVQIRIGVHQGPVIAGIIGQHKFIYDLWGDTVNTAARMESHGIAGRLQVT